MIVMYLNRIIVVYQGVIIHIIATLYVVIVVCGLVGYKLSFTGEFISHNDMYVTCNVGQLIIS